MSQNNSSYRGGTVLKCATLAVFNRGRTEVEGGLFCLKTIEHVRRWGTTEPVCAQVGSRGVELLLTFAVKHCEIMCA